jgi:hypothetical protein
MGAEGVGGLRRYRRKSRPGSQWRLIDMVGEDAKGRSRGERQEGADLLRYC